MKKVKVLVQRGEAKILYEIKSIHENENAVLLENPNDTTDWLLVDRDKIRKRFTGGLFYNHEK